MHARLVKFLYQRKTAIAVLLVVLAGVLCAGIPKLSISSDNRGFFDPNSAEVKALEAIDDDFSLSPIVILMVQPPEGMASDPAFLSYLDDMTEAAWFLPNVRRVDSATNATVVRSSGFDIVIEPLLADATDLDAASANQFIENALAEDNLVNRLISADGHVFGLSISLFFPADAPRDAERQFVAALEEFKTEWESGFDGTKLYSTGSLIGGQTLGIAAFDDIRLLLPIALAATTILLFVFLGSLRLVALVTFVLVLATLSTFGFAGWLELELTAGTAISPVAVLVLISASCIHIILSWRRASADPDIEDPTAHAFDENLAPVFVTNLTTAFGYLCLNFAVSPPLREMGNIVAFGLLFGMCVALTVVPIGLSYMKSQRRDFRVLSARVMEDLSDTLVRWRKIWFMAFPVGISFAIYGLTLIEFDDNLVRYFDDRYAFRTESETIQDNLTGLDSVSFVFEAQDGQTIFDPEFLKSIERFNDWLDTQPNVQGVNSVASLIASIHKSFNEDDPAFDRVADTEEANAQLLFLYEMSLPVGLDLTSVIDISQTKTLLNVGLQTDHSRDLRGFASAAEAWLLENTPQIATKAEGASITFANLSARNNAQMVYGLILVLLVVSATMMVSLRSLKYGAISLVPNVIPAVLAFGAWNWLVGDVNLGSTIVTTMTFGIVVDDTVHFLMHYLRLKRSGSSTDAALRGTFSVVGTAIIVTTFTLSAGFFVMSQSGFAINQHVGLLTVFVVGFALISDLTLLPSILKTVEEKENA